MSKNDITGDDIKTDAPSDKFRSGWDLLWGDKRKQKPETPSVFSEWDPQGEILRRAQSVSIELKPKYAPELTEEFIKGFFPNKA